MTASTWCSNRGTCRLTSCCTTPVERGRGPINTNRSRVACWGRARAWHSRSRLISAIGFTPTTSTSSIHATGSWLLARERPGTAMRLTLVHPCVGRRRGQPYIRTWQMEPLAPATIAGLTPKNSGFEVRFYDDRTENIPFDESTDLVAMSVETYTAKRSYQIASEFRRRGIPVVMGGFHPTLVPEEASDYAEAIIIGEAEGVWPKIGRA